MPHNFALTPPTPKTEVGSQESIRSPSALSRSSPNMFSSGPRTLSNVGMGKIEHVIEHAPTKVTDARKGDGQGRSRASYMARVEGA